MKDASVYLKHIQDAIARIESYTGQGRKAFFDNTMVQDAVYATSPPSSATSESCSAECPPTNPPRVEPVLA